VAASQAAELRYWFWFVDLIMMQMDYEHVFGKSVDDNESDDDDESE